MAIDAYGLDLLFRKARTHNKFTDQPVTDDELRALHDLLRQGPTSANCSPARFLFLRTKEAKQKLAPALSSGNHDKTMAAPVTAATSCSAAIATASCGCTCRGPARAARRRVRP